MAQNVALITGGMGGLGETISTKMAAAGYRVVGGLSATSAAWRCASRKPWCARRGTRASAAHSATPPSAPPSPTRSGSPATLRFSRSERIEFRPSEA